MRHRQPGSGPAARARSARGRQRANGRPVAERETVTILQTPRALPSADDVLHAIGQSLEDDKAQDVVVIDLFGKSTLADYMVLASGTSKRHLGSMADHVVEKAKEAGAGAVAVEGADSEEWVLIDTGDVIVHLFRPEARSFYALERLWGGPSQHVQRSAARSETDAVA